MSVLSLRTSVRISLNRASFLLVFQQPSQLIFSMGGDGCFFDRGTSAGDARHNPDHRNRAYALQFGHFSEHARQNSFHSQVCDFRMYRCLNQVSNRLLVKDMMQVA